MLKKTLAWMLTLCMILSVVPIGVFAEDIVVDSWSGLQDAINNSGDGSTIILGNDVSNTEGHVAEVVTVDGTTSFATLAEAIAAAGDGDTINLLKEVSLDADETITIPEGKSITLDLKNLTITGVSDDADKNDDGKFTSADNEVMFDVRGTLTIKNGTVTLKHQDTNLAWDGCTEIFYVAFNGALYVENATLENLGGSDMAFAIDLVNATNTTLSIEDSTIESTYIPVRIFNNSSGMNTVSIEDSSLIGSSRALWVHIYTEADTGNKGVKDATLSLDIYDNGNTFTANNKDRLIEFGFTNPINFDADGNLVARNEYALNYAVAKGGKVTVGDDITLTAPVTVPAGNIVTLDLNGKTISQSVACTASYGMIVNNGQLTILDSSEPSTGKISFTDTSAGDPNFGWGSYTLINYGTLVVEGGTIENLSTQNPGNGAANVHMYCAIQQGSGAVSTTINGGTISTPTYRSVRTNTGMLTVNGGIFEGQIWVQPNQGNAAIEINGGTFAPCGNDGSSVFMTNKGENYTVSSAAISGGTFNGKIGCSDASADALTGAVTGGTFSATAKEGTNAALLAEGYAFIANTDGTYTVGTAPVVPDGPIEIPEDIVDTIVGGNASEEYKTNVENLVKEIQENKALENYEPANVPADAELVIELTGMIVGTGASDVPTRIVFDVAPMKGSDKVTDLTEAITFRLPIPASVTKTHAKVYHDGTLMGTYEIKNDGNGKYVEVSSQNFSEFAVEPISIVSIGTDEYATLADAIAAANAGDTIVLVADIADLDITITKNITLDLGGNTLTDAYIIIAAKVTIQNGSIKNTNEPYPLKVTGSGELTVKGVAIEASNSDRAIWLDGSSSVLNFEEGSSILATKGENNNKSKIYGVWVSQGATANINGGTIEVDAGANATAVAIFGNYVNTVNINGGKISTSGKNYCYAIWVDGDVTVTGGEIITNEKQYGYSSGITYGYNYAIYTKGDVEPLTQMTWLKRLWIGRISPNAREYKEMFQKNMPDCEVNMDVIYSTGQGWRQAKNYFDMRDVLGMFYMK